MLHSERTVAIPISPEPKSCAAFSVCQSIFRAWLDRAAVMEPDAEILDNRARAGFKASRPDRRVVCRRLGAVIDADMGPHEFLVTNEDEI